MAQNKTTITWLIDVAANATNAMKGLVNAANGLNKTLRKSANTASQLYTPQQIQALQNAVSHAQDKIEDNEKTLDAIEDELKGIRIFPGARNQLNSLLTIARTKHRLAQKARFNQIGTPEEYKNIDETYKNLVIQAQEVSDAMRGLADLELRRSKGESYESLRAAIQGQQETLRAAELALSSRMQEFEQSSKYLTAMQEGLDKANRRYVEEGVAGFLNALDDPMGQIKGGLVSITKGDMKKAIAQFVKAGGLARGLSAAAGKRADNTDSFTGVEKKISGTSQMFARLIGGLAEKAEASAGFLRAGFVAFSIVKFIMNSGDKARELNKALLGARSLSDVGIDITAQGDPSKVSGEFSDINARFTDILLSGSDLNPFTKSKDELLAAQGELAGLYVPRATDNLKTAADSITELNKLSNLNFALQRQWGMATGELAQKEIELINEYGYSSDQVRSLFGAFEKISKNSTIPISKLISSASALADQTPVFGNTLSQTAVIYQRLYDLKVFGTKELNTYLQSLSNIFKDKGTAGKAVAAIITSSDKKHKSLVDVFTKEINMLDTSRDPNSGRRKQILENARDMLTKAKGRGLGLDEQQAVAAATNLLGIQSKRAVLGLALFSDTELDSHDLRKISRERLLTEAQRISPNDKNLASTLLIDLQATLDKNPNMTIRQALMQIKDVKKSEADSAITELENAMKATAGAFSPPLQGLKNFTDSLFGKFYNMMNSLSTFLQRFFFTPVFKVIAGAMGLGTPDDSTSKATLAVSTAMDKVYDTLEESTKTLSDRNSNPRQKAQASAAFYDALNGLGKAIADKGAAGTAVGRSMLQHNTLNLSQFFKLTGSTSIDFSKLEDFPKELRDELSTFLGQQKVEVQPGAVKVPVLNVPSIQASVPKKGTQRNFGTSNKVVMNLTNNFSLNEKDKEKLDYLKDHPTDPRSLVLAALHTKYQGKPIFSVILRHFLAKIDTSNPAIDDLSKFKDALDKLGDGLENNYKNLSNDQTRVLQDDLKNNKGAISDIIKRWSTSDIVPRTPPPAATPPAATPPVPTPNPSGSGRAVSPPQPAAPAVPTQEIKYNVKFVRLNVTVVPKVDLANAVRDICQKFASEAVTRQAAAGPAKQTPSQKGKK